MTDRITSLRKTEVSRLKRAFNAATKRIRRYQAAHPALNENDGGYYIDGSYRQDFGSTGFAEPSFRMWELGNVKARTIFIYQKIDWSQWSRGSFDPEVDINEYRLAIEDRSIRTYGGHHDGIARLRLDELAEDQDFTLDMIVGITDLAIAFFATDEALKQAVEKFSKRMSHSARGKLVFA